MMDGVQNDAAGIDECFKHAATSIQYAEAVMESTKANVEKAKASKDARNKVISKASDIVNALLEPASQVANLLNSLGGPFPPCGVAGSVLQGIIDLESDRRENDARIGLVFADMSTTLVVLGTLKPGFQQNKVLTVPLSDLLIRICDTMKNFGQFSEAFYEAKALKSKLKHLIHAKSNKERLTEFHEQFNKYKKDLTVLISHQTLLVSTSNSTSLASIEGKIDKMYSFFASLNDEKEDQAAEFVDRNGGEEIVKNNDRLIDSLASKLGESITPSVRRAVKESAEEIFKQSQASFNLKFQFAIEQRIEDSTDAILRELKSGPYELIGDPDMKEIWKATAAKESSVKRRQFIDAMAYYFNVQWKSYKVTYKADREDAWTRSIVSKVHYHPAIGDAIDDDASGYISVTELNEFLRKKPKEWTGPQWIAYWAYGWDADNVFYQERIDKCYKQLESLRDKSGPKSDCIKHYLEETQESIQTIARSVYTMSELDATANTKMNRLRSEWRTQMENVIKTRLKAVNFKVEYDAISAICGSERVEATFLPLVSLILARHVHMLSQTTVSYEDVDEAINAMDTLVEVVHTRIDELRLIWRRQRMDVNVQIRYYANGLLEDYYKAKLSDFETDNGEDDMSSWDSEDEWGSEDDADEEVHAGKANHPTAPSAQAQERSMPVQDDGDYGAPTRNINRDVGEQSQRYRADDQERNTPSFSAQRDDGYPNEGGGFGVREQDVPIDPEPDFAGRSSEPPPDSDEEQEAVGDDRDDDQEPEEDVEVDEGDAQDNEGDSDEEDTDDET